MKKKALFKKALKILSISLLGAALVIITSVAIMTAANIKSEINRTLKKAELVQKQKISKPEVRIVGFIDSTSAAAAISKIKQLERDPRFERIWIILLSEGGFVDPALAICQTMRNCQKPVIIKSSMALSMAGLILSSGTKGKRLVKKNGEFMIHLPHAKNPKQRTIWTPLANKILSMIDEAIFISILSKNTGQNPLVLKRCLEKKTWMTAQEAVNFGLADSVFTKWK